MGSTISAIDTGTRIADDARMNNNNAPTARFKSTDFLTITVQYPNETRVHRFFPHRAELSDKLAMIARAFDMDHAIVRVFDPNGNALDCACCNGDTAAGRDLLRQLGEVRNDV